MAVWWIIAKYNTKLNLGKFIRKKEFFFPFVFVIYLLYLVFCRYFILANPENVILELLADKMLFAILLDLLMLYVFIYLIIIHVFTGIRRQNKSSVELLLSAPVRSEDIVLGETIGMLPIYFLVLPAVLIPALLLGYIRAGVGLFGLIKILFSQLMLFFVAVGVGAIFLAFIQSSIQRTKSSKYFRIVAMFVSAGLYLSIYLLRSWINYAETLTQNTIFGIFPTSLSGNVIFSEITGFVPNPSTVLTFVLLAVWIIIIYGVGIRIASKTYSLEKEFSSAPIVIKKEGILHKLVRKITPPSYTEKVLTHFKIFFRNSHNAALSIYMLIVAYFLPIISVWNARSEIGFISYFMGIIMVPMFLSISMVSIFSLSKDALWIWKKAPNGSNLFLNSKWIQSYILGLLYLPIPIINGFIVGFDRVNPLTVVFTVLFLLFINAFAVSYSMFLNILSPTKNIEGGKVGLNSIISSLTLFALLIFTSIPIMKGMSFYLFVLVFGPLLNLLGWIFVRASRKRIDHVMDI